jgi:PAS domain S-box-containing protein
LRAFKILLIEDDENMFTSFKGHLEKLYAKHQLKWVNNYEMGVSAIKEAHFDVCFIDLFLGQKTGLDFFDEIKNEVHIPPVILLTDHSDRTSDLKALESGISDYITKDSLNSELIDRVMRYSVSRSYLLNKILTEKYKYNSLFNTSLDPIALCYNDFKIYETNNAFKNILGTNYASIEGLLFEEFISQLLNENESFDSSVLPDGFKNHYFEVYAEGQIHHFLISAIRTSFDGNTNGGYQIVFHDISHIIKSEKEKSQQDKKEFTEKIAKLIAHEVRNPLSNITLASSELKSDLNNSDINTSVLIDIIARNALRINGLIDQLLDSSRTAELTFEKTTIDSLVQSTVNLSQDRIDLAEVELIIDINNLHLEIEVDQSKLSLALSNIMINAIEAMNETEIPKLIVKCYQLEGFFYFDITDNGKGMNDVVSSRIFEPFFSNKRGGKGLGMTLSKNIIEEHGGSLTINSEIGYGTTISVKMQLARTA